MTNDPAWWQALADLLPPALAAEVMEGWSIGEQEGALDHLVSSLLDLDIAIGDGDRARLAVTAEDWGERVALESRILQCPSRPDGSGVRLVEPVDAEPLPGAAFGHLGTLERAVGPGRPLRALPAGRAGAGRPGRAVGGRGARRAQPVRRPAGTVAASRRCLSASRRDSGLSRSARAATNFRTHSGSVLACC